MEEYEDEFLTKAIGHDYGNDGFGNKGRVHGNKGGPSYSSKEVICGKKIWTAEDDAKLLELVEAHGRHKHAWDTIILGLPGRTARSCRARWFRSILPTLVDDKKRKRPGVWTAEEDEQLTQLVGKYGRNWKKVCIEMPGRTADACDIHWYGVICRRAKKEQQMQGSYNGGNAESAVEEIPSNILNRRKWTLAEEAMLCQLVETYGTSERAWPIIANALERSITSCKGHFYTVLNKRGAPVLSSPAGDAAGFDFADPSGGSAVTNEPKDDTRRRWDPTELQQLTDLVNGGVTWTDISTVFHRSEEACKKQYNKLFPLPDNNSLYLANTTLLNSSGIDNGSGGDDSQNHSNPTPNKWSVKALRRWSVEEDEQLRQLVENYGRKNWSVVSSKLPGRSPDACECRWRDKLYPKLLLLEKELRDQITTGSVSTMIPSLSEISSSVNADGEKPSQLSSLIPLQVLAMNQPVQLQPQVRYSDAEDERLKQLIETYGSSGQAAWEKIASQMPGRSVNSCRMRWKQALRHNVSGAKKDGALGEFAEV